MAKKKKETQKMKAELLDRLREIFKNSFLVKLTDEYFDDIEQFTYKTLFNGNDIQEAYKFDEEVALAFDGENIRDLLFILSGTELKKED